jgi:hypothetical protein
MTSKVPSTDQERRDIYRALNLREKLLTSQAYLTVLSESNNHPGGNFPFGTRSQMVEIHLAVNHFVICLAHRYVWPNGNQMTEPDPKRITIDDLSLIQGLKPLPNP